MSLPSLPKLAALADQEHFHTHALAKALGMSRRTLCREFIDTLGLPPSVWLGQRRESRIVELLTVADACMGEVASALTLTCPPNRVRLMKMTASTAPSAARAIPAAWPRSA